MRCCAPGCKNDSRYSSKSQGITFHAFPNEPDLRSLWLQVLGKKGSWEPNNRSAICSEHFLYDDLYKTKSGLQKVRPGAVPLIVHVLLDSSNCVYDEPAAAKVCRICLVMDCKLFPIKKYKLEQAYEHLTGVSLSTEARLPQKLCVECTQRLINFNRFRLKSLRANSLMTKLLKKHDHLTIQKLRSINRENNQLTSNLNTKLYIDHYDLYIDDDLPVIPTPEEIKTENDVRESDTDVENEEDSNLYIDIDLPVTPPPEQIKTENDVRESDTDVENEEDSNLYIDIDLPVTPPPEQIKAENDLRESDTDIENENSDEKIFIIEIDEDYLQKDDHSTDVNLPLELHKIKKPKGKKAVKKDPEVPDKKKKQCWNAADLNETLFTITELTTEEQIADIEKRQEGSNYKNSIFKCTECYKGFKHEDAFKSHMLRHTTKCGDHICPVCKIYFKKAKDMRSHKTARHSQQISCKQCSFITNSRHAARLHERWHNGKMYKCPHCPDEFDKISTYMGHIRIKHPSDFVCQLCGYSFVSEKGIMLHKKLKHRLENVTIPEDAPTCDLCNVRFMDTDALKRHIKLSARHTTIDEDSEPDKPQQRGVRDRRRVRNRRERDGGDRADGPIPCEQVSARHNTTDEGSSEPDKLQLRGVRDRRGLRQRRERDGGDRADGPIPCEQCGVQVQSWRHYSGHFRRMHPDMNRTIFPSITTTCMCEVCGRILQNYAHLKDHRWLHTGELPFKCDFCGKCFRMKQRLDTHRRNHIAEKTTYVCDVCGKQFSTHSNRLRHMYIHTGLKPFQCEMCGKCFMHRCQRREHINYVHLKKPWPKRSRGKRRQDRLA